MTSKPYRIAHFGDLHLQTWGEEFDWVLWMARRARELGADHLVFTGDIVDTARVDVVEGLFDELAAMGLGPREVSFVPGNHDIYPLAWGIDLHTLIGFGRTLAMRSQPNYEKLCELSARMHGAPHGRLLHEEGFPWSKRLAPGIVLLGMDSTRSHSANPTHWAEGQLDKSAMKSVAAHLAGLSGVTHRIVAMHHRPFDDFESASDMFPMHFEQPSAAAVRKWLDAAGVTAVLCGHVHEDKARRTAGGAHVFTTDSGCYEFDDDSGLTGRSFRMVSYGPGRRVSSRLVEVNEHD